jgi:drug/metabolite transporter (DMT)-like permease
MTTRPGPAVWAALAVVYVVWGSIYLGIRVTINDFPALGSMALRFVLAGLLMLGWVAWRSGWAALRMERRELVNVAVLGVLLLGIGNGGNAYGQLVGVPSGTTALLIASVPMFVMGLAFLDGERPTPAAIAALALGLIGLGVLVLGRSGSGGGLPVMGVVTILLASLAWAYGSWIKPRLVVPVNHWVGTAHQMVAAGLFLLVLSVARRERWSTAVGAPSALALAYLVVVGSIVGFTAYSWLLGKAPLGLIATHTFVNPVVAVALGTVFLDEPLSMPVLVGGSLIVVSVTVSIAEQLVRGRSAEPA